ncbi:MAG TPA: hypothetical protein VFG33_30675 [Kribbella sp.]|uniref:hypothetical protein n=1 Tax=Kribbella sp. TaxID=1871183 RepID=UPI002D787F1D|nr:hypothetical protein [Kribbella sp.]HET6297790.1 hypothetical protein [Kribbella sp.]
MNPEELRERMRQAAASVTVADAPLAGIESRARSISRRRATATVCALAVLIGSAGLLGSGRLTGQPAPSVPIATGEIDGTVTFPDRASDQYLRANPVTVTMAGRQSAPAATELGVLTAGDSLWLRFSCLAAVSLVTFTVSPAPSEKPQSPLVEKTPCGPTAALIRVKVPTGWPVGNQSTLTVDAGARPDPTAYALAGGITVEIGRYSDSEEQCPKQHCLT